MASSAATAATEAGARAPEGGRDASDVVLATVPVGKDGLPLVKEEEEEDEGSDEDDLWDVDGEMTAEQVNAALAEEKRRKKAKAKAAKEKAEYDLVLSNLRGDSRLAWKEDVAARKAARDPRRRIAKMTSTVKTIASQEWQLIKHDVEEFMTPAWVNQGKQRTEYLSRVARAERRMGRIYADLATVRTKQKKAKRAEFMSWKKRKQEIKDLQVKDRFLGDLVEKNVAEEREQTINEFKRRVQLEIKERKEKETARLVAHKKKRSDERTERRATILKFWGKAESELKEEANARNEAREKKIQDGRGQGAAAALRYEEALRDAAREEDQVAGPWGFERLREDEEEHEGGGKKKRAIATQKPVSVDDEEASATKGEDDRILRQGMAGARDGLGVFEVNTGDGEFHGFNGGGNVAGVDDSEVQLFQPLQHAAHEERWTKLNELEAEVGRTEALYAAVTEEGRVAEEEGSSLTAVRTRLEREMVQIDEEHSAMLLVQRMANRDLTPAEVEAMHLRKTRRAAIRDSLREAHERYIKSAATRKATEVQGLKLARQLAVIRERARADREALEAENRGCGSLPVIVGRSLPRAIADAKSAGVAAGNRAPSFESQTLGGGVRGGSVGGDNNRIKGGRSNTKTSNTLQATNGKTGGGVSTEDMIAGNPRRALEEVSLRAKLEVVRKEVDATLKMHATMASGERTSWLKQIERQNEENAYEALLTRLARATERLKLVDGENAREALSTAIQLFSADGAKALLEPPVIKHEGIVPWWRYRHKNETLGVERWCPPDVEDEPPKRQGKELVGNGQDKTPQTSSGLPDTYSANEEGGERNGRSEKSVRADDRSSGVAIDNRDETMGVSLGRVTQGHIVGIMPMPVNGLWTVRIAVTRRMPEDTAGEPVVLRDKGNNGATTTNESNPEIGGASPDRGDAEEFNHDPTDWVSVRMGPSLTSLHHVADVKNVVNDDLGEVRYEMNHHFRGAKLAYRFDFSSSCLLPEAHMSVEPGIFATFEMAPLEWVGNRAISSYVKEVRLDLRSTEASTVRLLEDMIRAETAEGETWDTNALHATLQRYPRKQYCRLVRETLETMREKAAQSKQNEARLANIYKQMVKGDAEPDGATKKFRDAVKLENKQQPLDAAEAEKLIHRLPPDERRLIRSMRSKDAYLKRKRDSQRHRIVAAEKMVGKKIEIYDGAANLWRMVVVDSVAVRWIDLGTKLVLRHVVRVLGAEPEGDCSSDNNKQNDNGSEKEGEGTTRERSYRGDGAGEGGNTEATSATEGGGGAKAAALTAEVDLDEVRWAECTGREKERRPSEPTAKKLAVSRASGGEAIVQKMEQTLAVLREELKQEVQALSKSRSIEDRAAAMAKEADVSKIKLQSKAEAEILVKSQKKIKTEVQSLARSLRGDWKLGIGAPPAGKGATAGVALSEARRKWVQNQVATAVGRSEQQYKFLARETAERRQREDEGLQKVFRAKTAAAEATRDAELARLKRLAKIERDRLIKEELGIPGFDKALQANIGCSHARTKAWGDKYGSGLRCRDCGMEATRMHQDPRQAKGIGFGEDPALVEAVERHRANEGGFRFETSAQLKEVEDERIRLEKERRVCFAEYDHMFYDLDDPEMMYELDRRHRHWLKENGVIRQGVLWRKEELLEWFDKREAEGDSEAAEMKEVMIAWYDNATRSGPLTYRTYDGRRKARFLDILSLFNRIMNSKVRIDELEALRRDQTRERVEFSQVIKRAHSDIPLLELTTSRAEAELGECQRMLEMRKDADRRHRHWQDVLAEVNVDLTHAEMRLAGQDFMVATANAKLRDATEQLRDVLLHRLRSEARIAEMEKRLAVVKENRQKYAEDHARLTHEIDLFYYTKRDSHVVTPIGWATVNSYREEDQMLVVTLPFCRPSARMWIPVEKVWQLDRAGQQAESVGMAAEDVQCHLLYRNERVTIARECGQMLTEERATKEMMREEADIAEEKRLAAKIVAQAKIAAPRLATMSAISEHRNRWVAYKVQKAVEQRERDIAKWETKTEGGGDDDDSLESTTKPRKVKGALERALMASRFRKEFVNVYVKTYVKSAELRVTKMLELRAKDRVEAITLDHIIGTYLGQFVKDVAQETLRAGLLAKKRAEDETGLVFPDPSHMQYGVYSTFRSWWVGRKEELERSVQRWNIVIAKNRERWEREHARVMEAQQIFLDRGLKEEARERVAKVCAEMAKEEKETRAFNKWELVRMLQEKRKMANEERATRSYMRALDLQRREEERQRKLKSAAEAKAERQQKWAAMTEEEKEVFLQEEKVAKKQEWIKKQAVLLGHAPAGGDYDGEDFGIGDDKTYASAASSRERRRLSIKAAKVRRRKQEVEITAMEAEDERSRLENQDHRAMLEIRLQRQIEMEQKAAAMRRQMAAEVSAAGGGQMATSIVHSMDSVCTGGRGGGGGDGSIAEGGSVGVEGRAGEIGGGVDIVDTSAGPTLFDDDYVSSSESELGEEERAFAEEMGLPTGDVDLIDSDHSSDEEDAGGAGDGTTRKSRKAAAEAAAAEAAAKAAENSWISGGGGAGRWGGGGGGGGGGDVGDRGDQVAVGGKEDNVRNAHTRAGHKEAVAQSGVLAVEGGGGDVDDEGHGREGTGNAAEVEGRADPAGDATLPSVAGLKGSAAKDTQSSQEAGGNDQNLGGVASPAALSRPSTASSYECSTDNWDDSADSGGGSNNNAGAGRPKTATERAREKRRREMLISGKGRSDGSAGGNRRSSSAPPRRLAADRQNDRGGGGGGGGAGGLGGRRRMFADYDDDSSSTEEETSSEEEDPGANRGGAATAVPKRKREAPHGGNPSKKAKKGKRAAAAAALAAAEAASLEEENPEIAKLARQRRVLERRVKHRLGRQRQRVIKRLRRAKEIREAEDKKIAMRLEQANQMAQLADAKAELAWLDAEGESRRLEKRLVGEREGLRKLQLFCQTKAREEIACREEAVLRTNEARKRQAIRDETFRWHTRCKEQEHRTLKWKTRVLKQTQFFNGRVVTGQYQRWETDWIYPRLHSLYFKSLVDILVNRAELIGAERRMMKIHDRLVRTSQAVAKKEALVDKLWKKQRRRELIYLRRSELGKRIFGKSQKKNLRKVFEAWRGFHLWLRNMREAFQLKYGVLKQEIDLNRVYEETDAASQRSQNTRPPSGKSGALPLTNKSLLHRFKERPIRCRNCQELYLEPQNHDLCCAYHPGEYKRACPRSCPGLTEKCMSHRVMRWTCCDKKEPGTWGSSGCKTRCHFPPFEGHPKLVDIVRKGAAEDRGSLAALDKELAELSSTDMRQAALQMKQQQLADIAGELKKERDVVARYKDLKFV
eukprot:g9227.t1